MQVPDIVPPSVVIVYEWKHLATLQCSVIKDVSNRSSFIPHTAVVSFRDQTRHPAAHATLLIFRMTCPTDLWCTGSEQMSS